MKKNFTAGLFVGTNLLLAVFLIMGISSPNLDNQNSATKVANSPTTGMEPFIGEISMFAGNFAPRGWALCDGQLLSISQNSALFSILGTTYGGDGRTSFGLPDLRGRVPIHAGTGPGLSNYRLGQKGGSETVTLTTSQMPSHNHTISASGKSPNSSSPNNSVMATLGPIPGIYSSEVGKKAQMKPTGNTGGNQGVDIRQPYATINYIIALQGVYPSRN